MDKKVKKLLKDNIPFDHYFEHANWTVETDEKNTTFKNKKAGVTLEKRGMVCHDKGSQNGWYIVEVKDAFSKYKTFYTPEMDMLCSRKFDDIEYTNDDSIYITKTRFSKRLDLCYKLYAPGNESFVLEELGLPYDTEFAQISPEILMNYTKVKLHNQTETSIFINIETGEHFISSFEEDLSDSIYENVAAEEFEKYQSEMKTTIESYKNYTSHSSYLNLFYSNTKLIGQCYSTYALYQAELDISLLIEGKKASPAMLEKFRMVKGLINKQKPIAQAKEKEESLDENGSQPGEE